MRELFGISLFEIRAHGVHIGDCLGRSNSRLQMSYRLEDRISALAHIQHALAARLLFVDDRHKEIGRNEQQGPAEFRLRHADNREGMVIHPDNPAHYASIVLKMSVPVSVSEHEIGRAVGAVLIGAMEEPAKIGLNPEHVEVVPGGCIA